jgi:arylsulfatase A-like enzyme/Flp pilus assembly protein TadD
VEGRALRRKHRLLGAFLALLAWELVSGCRRESRLLFRSAPVILVSVDTLRADRLPAYGYAAVDTPNLDILRKDSVLFENAYSHVPLTLPSHATLFTGVLPPVHGVRDNIGYRLGNSPETLAGFLKKQGYATGAAISSIVLSGKTGVGRGFDFYEDDVEPAEIGQSLGRVQRAGDATAARLSEWLREKRDAPVFAFLHLFEPHSPYDPPAPYRNRYKSLYDGEIARTDEILGDFLQDLKERDLYDRSVILFLSDHGEGLGDHGEEEHGVLLYREAIHVPLFLKLPGSRRGGESVAAPVALTDIFPTVARLLGLPAPAGLPGVSLTERLGGAAAPARRIYSETLYPRLHLGWADLASLVDERYHYIEAPRPELYDLAADPGEKKDLASGLPPAFRSLRAELSRLPRPLQPPGASDPEQVAKLAALGYISATTADLASKDLPDPKDRVDAVEKLKKGFGLLKANEFAGARDIFRDLVRENPGMIDVWQMLGQAEQKLGRFDEALAALKQAAKLAPGNPQVLLALSEHYSEVGKYAEARAHAELARDSGVADAHMNLAKIALAQGDLQAAEREGKAALEEHPNRRIPHLILGRVKRDRRDLQGALTELEEARRLGLEGKQPPLYNLNFLRGDVLSRLGREAEGEAAFREEIRDFPGAPPPYTGLAMLYASQEKSEEARAVLESLARARTPEAIFAAARTFEILGDPESAALLRAQGRRLFPGARERKSPANGA